MTDKVLSNGGRLLLVGFDPHHLQEWALDDPRVVIWDSQSLPRTSQTPIVPSNVRRILIGRYISHNHGASVLKEARKRKVIVEYGNNGTARRLLDNLHGTEDKMAQFEHIQLAPPTAPTTPIPPKMPAPGTKFEGKVRDFIAKYVNPDFKLYSEEARRLVPIAQQVGFKTTEASIAQELRIRMPGRGKFAGKRTPRVETPTKPQKTAGAVELTEVVKFIDDSIAAMQLLREQVIRYEENVRVRVRKALQDLV